MAKFENKEYKHIDLLEDKPEFFDNDSLMAYYQRNYQGKEISEELKKSVSKMDAFANQVKEADIIIMAYPMHNFGIPGIVKTWFDNIMQKGMAFDYGPTGPFGMYKGKKSLTVYTSGGSYTPDKVSINYPEWNTLELLAKIEFAFMGFEKAEVIGATTSNPKMKEENMDTAKAKIDAVLNEWYS